MIGRNMMIKTLLRLIVPISVFIVSTSCVNLPLPKTERKQAQFSDIPEPDKSIFKRTEDDTADAVWRSKIGSFISLYSDCRAQADTSLDLAAKQVVKLFDSVEVVEESDQMIGERGAKQVFIKGEVDGLAMHADIWIFKWRGCQVTLSYIGKPQHFEQGHAAFNKYVGSFEL